MSVHNSWHYDISMRMVSSTLRYKIYDPTVSPTSCYEIISGHLLATIKDGVYSQNKPQLFTVALGEMFTHYEDRAFQRKPGKPRTRSKSR